MEPLPHDVVELILERLPVKTLVRFKAVSRQWRSTIESSIFQERQLIHRQKSGDPDVVMVSVSVEDSVSETRTEYLRTLVLGSSSSVNIPIPYENRDYFVCPNSCDGLVCLYHFEEHICCLVLNPATGWHRLVPLSGVQKLAIHMKENSIESLYPSPPLGFGKDIINNIYKPVWLYNSSHFGLENATTCEVFDFSTNTWRYVTPTPPYQIFPYQSPVYINGSLYWLTNCEETKVLCFDLHTETFQVIIPKAPLVDDLYCGITCNLDNRFCVIKEEGSNNVIWSFDSSNQTWDKMYSVSFSDLAMPIAILKKKKLLFHYTDLPGTLATFDMESKSNEYDVVFSDEDIGYPLCYFQSLVSIS